MKLTRRQFLGWALAVGGGAVAGKAIHLFANSFPRYEPTFGIWIDKEGTISFDEVKQLSLRLDRIWDMIPEYKKTIPVTEDILNKWAFEVLPFFQYEGAVNTVAVPKYLKFVPFIEGDTHMHVLGRSDCDSYAVVNLRYLNDMSVLYGDISILATETHELAHVQQGERLCQKSSREDIESSAQIVTLEILAAMANQGNEYALIAFTDEIRSLAIGTAYYIAMETNQVDQYFALRATMSPGKQSLARFEKSRRYWQNQPDKLKDILYKYSFMPLDRIVQTHLSGGDTIKGMSLNNVLLRGGMFNDGRGTEDSYFKIDDTLYLVRTLEKIVMEKYGR